MRCFIQTCWKELMFICLNFLCKNIHLFISFHSIECLNILFGLVSYWWLSRFFSLSEGCWHIYCTRSGFSYSLWPSRFAPMCLECWFCVHRCMCAFLSWQYIKFMFFYIVLCIRTGPYAWIERKGQTPICLGRVVHLIRRHELK
jgi:hypothetical protein